VVRDRADVLVAIGQPSTRQGECEMIGSRSTNRVVAVAVVLLLAAAACGDDGSSDGDLTAFCEASDRLETSEPFDFLDDRDAYEAAINEMEAALADVRSNAPSEISDEVEEGAQGMEEVLAALRGIEDPSDEAEVEAALSALDDTAVTGVGSGSDLDAYLVENCDS
jgi:hypothetical protein